MQIGHWDPALHKTIDGMKRIQTASKIKPENIQHIDPAKQTGHFIGSEGLVYETTLSACTCVDFERRQLPCKHIYRLASELGAPILESIPQFDPYSAFDYNVEEDISRLESRFRSGQLTYDAFIKCADALHASAAKSKRKRGRPAK